MIEAEPIGWLNTGLPLLVLGALAVLLPRLTVPPRSRSHGAVARGVLVAACGVLAAGVAVFAGTYAARGAEIGRAFTSMPAATGLFFLRLSGLSALAWAPLLGLVWLSEAQAVERRRGEDAMRTGRK